MTRNERRIHGFATLFFLSGGAIAVAFKTGFYHTMAIHGCALIPLLVLGIAACMAIAAVYLASLATQESVRWPAKILAILPISIILAAIGYFAYSIAST
jgi:hypothetical protein